MEGRDDQLFTNLEYRQKRHPVGFGIKEKKQTGILDMTHSTVDPPAGECHSNNELKHPLCQSGNQNECTVSAENLQGHCRGHLLY